MSSLNEHSVSSAFNLTEARLEDMDELSDIYIACHENDDVWPKLIGTMKHEDHHAWLTANRKRGVRPGNSIVKITEIDSGRIVAFARLSAPHKLTPEEQAVADKHVPIPEGHNAELVAGFFERLDSTPKYGFDPTEHFHRRGTMVRPEYQRQGHGKALGLYCNTIADAAGRRTYVVAGRNSKPLFESQGFKVLGEENFDMKKFGGSAEDGKLWVMMREPDANTA